MAKFKLLTIHTNTRLSPRLVNVLAVVAEEYNNTTLRTNRDGLVVEVEVWGRQIP